MASNSYPCSQHCITQANSGIIFPHIASVRWTEKKSTTIIASHNRRSNLHTHTHTHTYTHTLTHSHTHTHTHTHKHTHKKNEMRACIILQTTLRLVIVMSVLATMGLDGVLIRDLYSLRRQLQYLSKQQQQQPQLQGRFYHTPEPAQHGRRRHGRRPREQAQTIHPATRDLDPTSVQSQAFDDNLLSGTVPMLLVPDFAALLLISYWICDASSETRRDARRRARRRGCLMSRRNRGHPSETRDNQPESTSPQQRPWWRSCCGRWKEIGQGNSGDHTSSSAIPLQSSQQSQQQPIMPSMRSERRFSTGLRNPCPVRDNVYHTICRVLSSIFLVALTIYKPVIYMVQLQDQLYHDQITRDCSSNNFIGGGENTTALQVADFCSLFRTRLVLTFVWALLVLAELVIAYAAGELCVGGEEIDQMSIGSNGDAGDEEQGRIEDGR